MKTEYRLKPTYSERSFARTSERLYRRIQAIHGPYLLQQTRPDLLVFESGVTFRVWVRATVEGLELVLRME